MTGRIVSDVIFRTVQFGNLVSQPALTGRTVVVGQRMI